MAWRYGVDHKINNVAETTQINKSSCIQTNESYRPHTYAYADTGASHNYATTEEPLQNKNINKFPVQIGLPNGQMLKSTHVGNIQLNVSLNAQITHVIPGLKHNLVSMGKIMRWRVWSMVWTKESNHIWQKR